MNEFLRPRSFACEEGAADFASARVYPTFLGPGPLAIIHAARSQPAPPPQNACCFSTPTSCVMKTVLGEGERSTRYWQDGF
ncbi:hypothetical protein CEXT_438881 [Caerostris extrusa]|uniref:Uncharacterized protein n=1 Tax=Caerostris extrusa TaxID=172846 RepID=A0AAV4VEH9_CAEEX|nr:hypothetical protein CEXT_438881 [Caerostris extrusa]